MISHLVKKKRRTQNLGNLNLHGKYTEHNIIWGEEYSVAVLLRRKGRLSVH